MPTPPAHSPGPPAPPIPLAELLASKDLGLRRIAGPAEAELLWVHTSEMADPYPYLLGGELLLSAGVLLTDPDHYVARLVEAGAAALGFGVRPVHETVPEALIEACDRYGLPLLEVPPETPFTTIARAVWRLMAEARHRELRRVTRAQQALATAAARPDPVPAVLHQLAAQLSGRAVLLTGGARRSTRRAGARPRRRRQRWHAWPGWSPANAPAPRVGHRHPRRHAPGRVRAGRRRGPRPGPGDPAAGGGRPHGGRDRGGPALPPGRPAPGRGRGGPLGGAGTAAARRHARRGGPAAGLRRPLDGDPRAPQRRHDSGRLDGRGAGGVAGLGAGGRGAGGRRGGKGAAPVDRRGSDPGSGRRRGGSAPGSDPATWRRRGGSAPGSAPATGRRRGAPTPPQAPTVPPQPGWTLGVSIPTPLAALGSADLRAARALAHAEATRAPLTVDTPVTGLAALIPPGQAAAHARTLLAPLTPPLADTLRCWLSLHGSWDRTAVALAVHRNTVRQRIGRCAVLLGVDLNDMDVRTELWFALRQEQPPAANGRPSHPP
ncbi:PucR family transcriptional regulator [Streptomyces microflavus]|uniref:PucR family transcriptional regulator n=1 Tax=Streptomyces microflavus TaxID=1919 RepID=UPI003B227B46